MTFVTLTALVGAGMVVGHHECQAMHRHSRVLVANTKAAPMVASGIITVSVIEVGFPLRPIPIVIRRNDVDLAGDRSKVLYQGHPVTPRGLVFMPQGSRYNKIFD
mgnify:CR=1 FL=1